MPSILITRPRVLSEVLASVLQSRGYETVIEPLLSIVPLATPFPKTETIDAVIVTSGNVFSALADRQVEVAGLLDKPCFCVGPHTAEKARAFGFRNVQSTSGGGVDLAVLIIRVYEGQKTSILHIVGKDVNDAMHRNLAARSHHVNVWPVYETIPAAGMTAPTRDLFTQQKLDAAVVFSPKTAQVLRRFLTDNKLEACCAGLTAICLSEAVADELIAIPWRRLLTAALPREDAMISCLQEACPVKS